MRPGLFHGAWRASLRRSLLELAFLVSRRSSLREPDLKREMLHASRATFFSPPPHTIHPHRLLSEDVRALRFPGVHPEAAAWLVRERQINAIGIDTASNDYGQSTRFETHVALLSQGVPVFENLGDLREFPGLGFEVIALPMKIAGGTGCPLRVIAVLPPPR